MILWVTSESFMDAKDRKVEAGEVAEFEKIAERESA
jgi:hypothetical protein